MFWPNDKVCLRGKFILGKNLLDRIFPVEKFLIEVHLEVLQKKFPLWSLRIL
jgi:hypothetical protein